MLRRYIRLLSNVLEWQKSQDRNGMQQHDVRIKCESHLNNQNSTYHVKPAVAFLKQEKLSNENSHVFRVNYAAPRHSSHTCDKSSSNLLMIAPNGLNAAISAGKRCITPSIVVTPGNFHRWSTSNYSCARKRISNLENIDSRPICKMYKFANFVNRLLYFSILIFFYFSIYRYFSSIKEEYIYSFLNILFKLEFFQVSINSHLKSNFDPILFGFSSDKS